MRTIDATELGLQIGQDGGELLLLPLTSLETLEVHGRTSAVWKGARIGALVGGGLGAIVAGVIIGEGCEISTNFSTGQLSFPHDESCEGEEVVVLVVGAAIVALAFGVVGAVVGAPFRTDKWEELPLSPRPDVRLRRSGRL